MNEFAVSSLVAVLRTGIVENGDRLVDVSKPEEETTSHLTPATPMHVTTPIQSNMQAV